MSHQTAGPFAVALGRTGRVEFLLRGQERQVHTQRQIFNFKTGPALDAFIRLAGIKGAWR